MISSRIHQDGLGGIAKVTYDHAVYGGAVIAAIEEAIVLPLALPDNAIIWNGCIDVLTPVLSEGANLLITFLDGGTESIATINDAAAELGSVGLVALTPAGVRATARKLQGDRSLMIGIFNAPITAGKFNIHLTYYLSD